MSDINKNSDLQWEQRLIELKKEVENKGIEYTNSIDCLVPEFSDATDYAWSQVEGAYEKGALDFAEPREKHILELEAQIEQLQKVNNDQKETLKKVRVALIQERTANLVNYGKGGVEMFDNMFEILKGVSN